MDKHGVNPLTSLTSWNLLRDMQFYSKYCATEFNDRWLMLDTDNQQTYPTNIDVSTVYYTIHGESIVFTKIQSNAPAAGYGILLRPSRMVMSNMGMIVEFEGYSVVNNFLNIMSLKTGWAWHPRIYITEGYQRMIFIHPTAPWNRVYEGQLLNEKAGYLAKEDAMLLMLSNVQHNIDTESDYTGFKLLAHRTMATMSPNYSQKEQIPNSNDPNIDDLAPALPVVEFLRSALYNLYDGVTHEKIVWANHDTLITMQNYISYLVSQAMWDIEPVAQFSARTMNSEAKVEKDKIVTEIKNSKGDIIFHLADTNLTDHPKLLNAVSVPRYSEEYERVLAEHLLKTEINPADYGYARIMKSVSKKGPVEYIVDFPNRESDFPPDAATATKKRSGVVEPTVEGVVNPTSERNRTVVLDLQNEGSIASITPNTNTPTAANVDVITTRRVV